MLFTFFLCLLTLSKGAVYHLVDEYSGETFFNGWNFFTGDDPTHGYVNYVSQSQAQSEGLINASSTNVYIGCDDTNVASGRGRNSVKITSKKTYNNGLFLLSLSHMPYGCGTWPAWWAVGPDWPNNGEIDIIEGVNEQNHNSQTLHTKNDCDMAGAPSNERSNMTGYYATGSNGQPAYNCYIYASNQYSNQGCSVESKQSNSYGDGLNKAGGGVYATELDDSAGIRIWWWIYSDVPSNVNSNSPDPDSWGEPVATFPFGNWCPSSNFKDLELIFDLTFCGDWAGSVWDDGCSSSTKDSSCNNYVQYNPTAFRDAYWDIKYVKVFQQ